MQKPEKHARPTLVSRVTRSTAFWMFLCLLALIVTFGLLSENMVFFNSSNFFTIALNASQLVLLAVGTSYLLGAGQLDLSIGSNLILASVLSGMTITGLAGTPAEIVAGEYPNLTFAVIAGVFVAIGSGSLFGLVNGLLVTKLRLNSFLVTIATTAIGLGLALVITHGANVPYIPRAMQTGFSIQKLFGVVSTVTELCDSLVCTEVINDKFTFDVMTREFKYGRRLGINYCFFQTQSYFSLSVRKSSNFAK